MTWLQRILFVSGVLLMFGGEVAAQDVDNCPRATAQPAEDELAMPCLVGMTVAQATLATIDNDLLSEYINDPGCVGTELSIASQIPVSGTIVKKAGAKVVLFTTTSVVVPDPSAFGNPTKMSPEQVQSSLINSGLSAQVLERYGDQPFCSKQVGNVRTFSHLEPKPGAPICRNQAIMVFAYNDPITESQLQCDDRDSIAFVPDAKGSRVSVITHPSCNSVLLMASHLPKS